MISDAAEQPEFASIQSACSLPSLVASTSILAYNPSDSGTCAPSARSETTGMCLAVTAARDPLTSEVAMYARTTAAGLAVTARERSWFMVAVEKFASKTLGCRPAALAAAVKSAATAPVKEVSSGSIIQICLPRNDATLILGTLGVDGAAMAAGRAALAWLTHVRAAAAEGPAVPVSEAESVPAPELQALAAIATAATARLLVRPSRHRGVRRADELVIEQLLR